MLWRILVLTVHEQAESPPAIVFMLLQGITLQTGNIEGVIMFKNECPGSSEIKQPKPEDIKCRYCGADIEIWSDETETKCRACGKVNTREMGPSCLDWCAFAKECIGEEKLRRIKAGLKSIN